MTSTRYDVSVVFKAQAGQIKRDLAALNKGATKFASTLRALKIGRLAGATGGTANLAAAMRKERERSTAALKKQNERFASQIAKAKTREKRTTERLANQITKAKGSALANQARLSSQMAKIKDRSILREKKATEKHTKQLARANDRAAVSAFNFREKQKQLRAEIKKLRAELRKTKSELKQTANAQSRVGRTAARAAPQVGRLAAAQKAYRNFRNNPIGSALDSSGQFLRRWVSLPAAVGAVGSVYAAGRMEQWRIGLETVLQDGPKAEKMMKKLIMFSDETPFTAQTVVQSAQRFVGAGVEKESEVVGIIRMLGDLAAGTGKGNQGLNDLVRGYGKAISKHRVDMEAFEPFITAGTGLSQQIAKQFFGGSIHRFYKHMERGRFTVDLLGKAIKAMTDPGGRFHESTKKQSQTILGLWSTFTSKLFTAGDALGNVITETYNYKENIRTASSAVEGFSKWLNEASPAARKAVGLGIGAAAVAGPIAGGMLAIGGVVAMIKGLFANTAALNRNTAALTANTVGGGAGGVVGGIGRGKGALRNAARGKLAAGKWAAAKAAASGGQWLTAGAAGAAAAKLKLSSLIRAITLLGTAKAIAGAAAGGAGLAAGYYGVDRLTHKSEKKADNNVRALSLLNQRRTLQGQLEMARNNVREAQETLEIRNREMKHAERSGEDLTNPAAFLNFAQSGLEKAKNKHSELQRRFWKTGSDAERLLRPHLGKNGEIDDKTYEQWRSVLMDENTTAIKGLTEVIEFFMQKITENERQLGIGTGYDKPKLGIYPAIAEDIP